MTCAICETRRPRRYCPGVRGEICSICCGTEREVTVSCPLDCPYLRDAREHERVAPVDPEKVPNRDIQVTEAFLTQHEPLLLFVGQTLAGAALETSGGVDFDVRDALDALIRTYRTLQSGVYYESLPTNALAGNIYAVVQQAVTEFRRNETEQLGITHTRDADVLGVLAFLQRLEFDRNNGRARGRAFVDFLRTFFSSPREEQSPSSPSLILP
jgi:hypothetical protein